MSELIEIIKSKIVICTGAISSVSTSENDKNAGEAVEHLARALSYLVQIEEREVK